MATHKPLEKLPVYRGDDIEVDVYDYLNSEDKELKALRERFRERKYTIAQVGLSYRLMNYWDEQGILPGPPRESAGGWRKFTFIELVWLRVALRLRDFGVSMQSIAEVKACIMEWNKKTEVYSLFEYYFYKALVNDSDRLVVYLPHMAAGLASTPELEETKRMFTGEQDMLLISLKSVARSMGLDPAPSKPLIYVSEAETHVLSAVRHGATTEIRIDVEGGQVKGFENSISLTDTSRIRQVIDSIEQGGKFGSLTTHYENGKGQALTVVDRKKFK